MKSFFSILALLLVTAASAPAQKPVKIGWDPPEPVDVGNIDGYHVYSVQIVPVLRPADYSVNIPTPLPPAYALTATRINPEPIPAGTLEYVIPDAMPGMQIIVKAFNSIGESPDSDILTLRPLPGKPAGLKTVALVISASRDLITWAPFAVLDAALGVDQFFRLDVRK